MPKESTKDLLKFFRPLSPEVQKRALWLREFVWDLYPKTNELIYDNYNAVAFGWSPTDKAGDVFCSIAVNTGVRFGFNWGFENSRPKGILEGEGSQYRSIKNYGRRRISERLYEKIVKGSISLFAYQGKEKKGDSAMKGTTIVKSIHR